MFVRISVPSKTTSSPVAPNSRPTTLPVGTPRTGSRSLAQYGVPNGSSGMSGSVVNEGSCRRAAACDSRTCSREPSSVKAMRSAPEPSTDRPSNWSVAGSSDTRQPAHTPALVPPVNQSRSADQTRSLAARLATRGTSGCQDVPTTMIRRAALSGRRGSAVAAPTAAARVCGPGWVGTATKCTEKAALGGRSPTAHVSRPPGKLLTTILAANRFVIVTFRAIAGPRLVTVRRKGDAPPTVTTSLGASKAIARSAWACGLTRLELMSHNWFASVRNARPWLPQRVSRAGMPARPGKARVPSNSPVSRSCARSCQVPRVLPR